MVDTPQNLEKSGHKKRHTKKHVFLSKQKHKHKHAKRRNTHRRRKHGHKRKSYKGGFGPGMNPFRGSWWQEPTNVGSNYFKYNPFGQAVGGQEPYFGDDQSEPQSTYGAFASANTPYQSGGGEVVDWYRGAVNGVKNYMPFLGRTWNGFPPGVSPSPLVQPSMMR